MRLLLLACLALLVVFRAEALIHGPIILWHDDPAHRARIVWVGGQPGGSAGEELEWAVGRAGFGYGDGDDQTVFANMRNRYDSIAIRRRLSLPGDLDPQDRLVLEVRYDDGFVAWLDGREVARSNVGERGGRLVATADHEAAGFEAIQLGRVQDLVRSERPVLALQGFNIRLKSSDFSLDARLVALRNGRRVEIVPQRSYWEYLAGGEADPMWFSQTSFEERENPEGQIAYDFAFGPGGGELRNRKEVRSHEFGDTGALVYSVEVDNLSPRQVYEFAILRRGDGRVGERYRFRSGQNARGGGCFVTGGDMFHRRNLLDAMNARAGLEDPEFALLGGDLAYANGVNGGRWFEWLDSWAEHARTPDGLLVPMVVAIGNHEVRGISYRPVDPPGPEAAPYFYSLFGAPDGEQVASRVVDFGDWLSLILLDSGHTASIASQVPFLRRAIDERRDVRSLFVCYHRPAFGTGVKPDADEIKQQWCPLFEAGGVDAVFENDHHVLKRTLGLSAGALDDAAGVPYIGDGAWGVNVRKINPAVIARRPWLVTAEASNHLWRIDMAEDGFTATAKSAAGEVLDQVARKWR